MRTRSPRVPRRRGATPAAAVAFLPGSLTARPGHVEIDGTCVATFAVVGYPRAVRPGWLTPLLTYPGRLDVSVHIDPVDRVTASRRLRRQLARLESGLRDDEERGRVADAAARAAAQDAQDLADRVARGEGALFRVGLYLTVRAGSPEALEAEAAAARAVAASLLLDARPVTYRSVQGFVTSLPLGVDQLRLRRTFDTAALAAAFPFTSPELTTARAGTGSPGGVLYGRAVGGTGLVFWDRFGGLDNHNAVILGRSGAGKSYLVKLELLRSLYRGVEALVLDPEDEYGVLAAAVGGATVRLGSPGGGVNPLAVPLAAGGGPAPRDALARRALFLRTVVAVLLGEQLSTPAAGALAAAVAAAYAAAGLTDDPRTWARRAPVLAEVVDQLEGAHDAPAAGELAARLRPFAHGAHRALFDPPTGPQPRSHLVVYALRALPDELRGVGTLLALDAVWRTVSDPARPVPRLVVVDEAWLLMRQREGADFLFRMAKSARKHWAGLTVATQDAADVLGSDLGRAVVANAATQILLRQAPQVIDEVGALFGLSDGERRFLLSARRGQGLLAAGTQRVAFEALASTAEHRLVTTDPAERAHTAGPGPVPAPGPRADEAEHDG